MEGFVGGTFPYNLIKGADYKLFIFRFWLVKVLPIDNIIVLSCKQEDQQNPKNYYPHFIIDLNFTRDLKPVNKTNKGLQTWQYNGYFINKDNSLN
jgi:phage anti-repressor protein